jgi:hypothetical protein
MFYSVVATQLASHVSGILYGWRRIAGFVHATLYSIPYFRLQNTRMQAYAFSPYCYDGDDF